MHIPKQLTAGDPPPVRLPVPGSARAGAARHIWRVLGAFVTRHMPAGWLRRTLYIVVPPLALLVLFAAGTIHRVYFDRSDLPDLQAFLRFEPPRIGEIYDDQGEVLIELAREYRRVVSYEEVPLILRKAILAAEDKNFFSHSGVEYRALPRVIEKSVVASFSGWWKGDGFRLRFPQGGSTLTQQLVRCYFLQDLTFRENGEAPLDNGLTLRILSAGLGVSATNKLFRKMEEVRLAIWLEEEMESLYGSPSQAKREIFARYASYIYLGHGRYGFSAASEYYFDKPLSSYTSDDAGMAALLAGISKSPGVYAPVPGDARPLRRRNEILALMARNGYIEDGLARRCQAEPIRVSTRSLVKTDAPGAIAVLLEELKQHSGSGFGIEDLFQGRIVVHSTVDGRVQTIVNGALESGLVRYEQRHPKSKGLIQGSVVVLRNDDAAILAAAGGRKLYEGRSTRYSDLNRVTGSLRQSGSAWKPMVYLAAFRQGLDLDGTVPDEPIQVPWGNRRGMKWISNYDNEFKGPISVRRALAESRNAVAVWIARQIGVDEVNRTARHMGIRTPQHRYISTALGSSEVRLLELADTYRAMASGTEADPYVIARVIETSSGMTLYETSHKSTELGAEGPSPAELSMIQEGLRGVVRLPEGTAHALDGPDFPIPVMGKTGTTNDFRDALFIGSTYGHLGTTVAVRVGFDDNRTLGRRETGSRVALPIFREIMLRLYGEQLVGPPPQFPCEIEARIDGYLAEQAVMGEEPDGPLGTTYGPVVMVKQEMSIRHCGDKSSGEETLVDSRPLTPTRPIVSVHRSQQEADITQERPERK